MPNLRVTPLFVAPKPEEDGTRVLTVSVPGVGNVDVAFSEAEAVRLTRIFQEGFLDRMEKRTIHPNYPQMTMVDVNIAHGRNGTALLLETAEIGSVAVAYAPALSAKLKFEIDRVDQANAARVIKN
jgi:hypothetical protein